jgi:predicted dehydrogenase
LVGDVDTISGYRSAYLHRKNSEIEDTGAAVLKMVNGAVGTINYTINSPKTIGSFTLIGEKGSITVEGWDLTNLKWEGPAPLTMSVPAEISSSESSNINKTSINYYTELYNELYASLERPVDPMETRQAVKTIEIIEKFYACTKEI